MVIVGISCADPELRYSLINYIYVKKAQQIDELMNLDVSDEKKFSCWLSEAGHFVVGLDEGKAAAFNLNGFKGPSWAPILFEKVRAYSFYDVVKYLVERLYGAPYEKLYSINVDKEKYKGPLTYQGWLNDIVISLKRYDENCLYNAIFKTIEEDGSELAIISDVSSPEDVKVIQDKGGKVVHILTEKLYGGKKQGLDLTIYNEVVEAYKVKNAKIYENFKNVINGWGAAL